MWVTATPATALSVIVAVASCLFSRSGRYYQYIRSETKHGSTRKGQGSASEMKVPVGGKSLDAAKTLRQAPNAKWPAPIHQAKAVVALIEAITPAICEAHWSNRDFVTVTALLRVNFVGGEIGHKGKRLDLHRPVDIARMPSLPLFVDEPDNDFQPKAKLGDIEAENVSAFAAPRASTRAPEPTYGLNEHDRVVAGSFPQIVQIGNFALNRICTE
jgi:hypothetical protein